MRIRARRALRREAFTLIELLVVMGIILILVSLTAAAIMKTLSKPGDVRVRNDMSQLDAAIAAFQQKYGVEYIPSQLSLHAHYSKYTNTQLDQESANYILKTIGKNSPGFMTQWKSATGIQWVQGSPAGVEHEILEGHQCLVFFLGGIVIFQNGQYSCVGFSTDASHPDALPQPGADRIGPFYLFDPSRLSIPPNKKYFPAYADAYSPRAGGPSNGQNQYYAYFSSYKHQNGYNRYSGTDCPSLSLNPNIPPDPVLNPPLWPYASSPASSTSPLQYVRPNDWQIICAGPDGIFGPGTNLSGTTGITPYYWNSGTAGAIPQWTLPSGAQVGGQDDRANFAFGRLQYGQ
jgi:prepilin-type N-terminal cleavage/methylation domain-containing protein